MILDKIVWPSFDDLEDEEDDVSLEDVCRLVGFLRCYIENGMHE